MNVAEAMRDAASILSATSDTARLDAELLMAHALEVSRSSLLLDNMKRTAPERFAEFVKRRALHEPVAYIVGETEFYGRTFRVTSDVLIPRSDSEALIEAALDTKLKTGRVLDMGTGSGALLLTLLAETGFEGIGIDCSLDALGVANKNMHCLGVEDRARLMQRDWHEPGWSDDLGMFDLILCNPPYVEEDAELDPDVREYEPPSALFAGPDGLDDYSALIPQLAGLMMPNAVAIFEIGATQAEAVAQIAETEGYVTEMRRDLANRPRALILRR